jgi:hypothetical protein
MGQLKSAIAEDGEYDLAAAMNANRLGVRPLFPRDLNCGISGTSNAEKIYMA